MKSPSSQSHLTRGVFKKHDQNTQYSRITKTNNYLNNLPEKPKQQLVSLKGETVCCNSIGSEEALTCDVTSLPVKSTKSKGLCVHIRENKWYDAGNIISVGANGASFSQTLENISLAYSPITKQIYSLDESPITADQDFLKLSDSLLDLKEGNYETSSPKGKLPQSCSSTVSSSSELSASNSVLNNDECQFSIGNHLKLWPLNTNFLKNVFSWKLKEDDKLFNKSPVRNSDKIGSSLALIQQCRPDNLPVKNAIEEENHKKQFNEILQAARKRELREERERRIQREIKLKEEERLSKDSQIWIIQVLPKFESIRNTKKVRDLWWRGLPSNVRGKVWKLAISNNLSITPYLYNLCLDRATSEPNKETLALIKLDVTRTFPNLCVFQNGGPLSESLQSILAAYAVYRPDVGYVQGMSFIGAILSLNMETIDAFTCFANLLNLPCHRAAFALDQNLMNVYYKVYSNALANKLPKVYSHFVSSGLSPDLYLLDWLYTIYAKAMPLDVTCRIWDILLRDGDEFLFRTALGILHLYQEELLRMDFVRIAQFLNRLPENIKVESLFNSINQMSTVVGTMSFQQMLNQAQVKK